MEAKEEPDRQTIEEEVKAVLEQRTMSASPAVPDKRLLAIFDAAQVNLAPILNQLETCIKGGYDTTAILSDLAVRLLDKEAIQSVCGEEKVLTCGDITDLADFAERRTFIAVPILSHPMAAKLALGIADTPCTYLIFQALRRGDSVIAAYDFIEGFDETEKTSQNLILERNYFKTLSNFGIQFAPIEQLAETLLSGDSLSHCPVDEKGAKTVISSSIIANLAPSVQEFVYTNPVVITPLARDLAAERGIRLIDKSKVI